MLKIDFNLSNLLPQIFNLKKIVITSFDEFKQDIGLNMGLNYLCKCFNLHDYKTSPYCNMYISLYQLIRDVNFSI